MDTVNLMNNMDSVNMASKANGYHHGNLRAELLMAAMDILDESGIEAVTIRQVARRVGVGHSAPANHFPHKQALLTQLAINIFNELGSLIKSQLQSAPEDVSEKISLLANTLVEFGLAKPNQYRLLWRRDYLDNSSEELNCAMDIIYDELLATLASSKKSKVSVESKAIALWSMIQGYVTMRIDGNLEAKNDEVSGQERQQAIIEVLLRGILS
ncbi:MAG: TetR/AcrR family transcriptional regulator [Bermanella sp.]